MATEPMTKARVKSSIGRLRLVLMFITIKTRERLILMLLLPNLGIRKSSARERLTRLETLNPSSRKKQFKDGRGHDWSLGRALNPRPCGAESCHSAYEADALCCETHLPG